MALHQTNKLDTKYSMKVGSKHPSVEILADHEEEKREDLEGESQDVTLTRPAKALAAILVTIVTGNDETCQLVCIDSSENTGVSTETDKFQTTDDLKQSLLRSPSSEILSTSTNTVLSNSNVSASSGIDFVECHTKIRNSHVEETINTISDVHMQTRKDASTTLLRRETPSTISQSPNPRTRYHKSVLKQKKHKCDFEGCQKSFTKSFNLNVHKRTHTGEKPYQSMWEGCQMKFARSDELTRHLRKHTGSKPYKCEMCSSEFSRSDHLSLHNKTHLNLGKLI